MFDCANEKDRDRESEKGWGRVEKRASGEKTQKKVGEREGVVANAGGGSGGSVGGVSARKWLCSGSGWWIV